MNIILACDNKYGIGIQNDLPPWNLSDDMKRFKLLTTGNGNNVVIMGKNTYQSFKKPLPNRINVVISASLFDKYKKSDNLKDEETIVKFNGFIFCKSLEDALSYSNLITFITENKGEIWIIGGAQLYESVFDYSIQSLLNDSNSVPINKIFVTVIDKTFLCDVYLKEKTVKFIESCEWTNTIKKNNNNLQYTFYEYISK